MQEKELKYIAEHYQTPCFIFDLEAVKERVKKMREIVGGAYHLCYSIKANPFLIPTMAEITDKLEVCSPGELSICKALRVEPTKILYSGVNKTEVDVTDAMEYGVIHYTAESLLHMDIVNRVAGKYQKKVEILPRLNAGSQFGMSKEDLFSIYANEEKYPNVIVKGIHYFAGTQRKKNDKQIKELDMLLGLIKEIQTTFNRKVEQIEYGPGLSVPLFEGDDFSDTLKPLENIHAKLKELSEVVDLTIEMGRFYSTFCGTYLTRAMDCKSNEGVNYCIVDGGMNHLNYYGQMMGMKVPHIQHLHACDDRTEKNWCLCGSLCTTADVLVRDVTLQGLHEDDYLAFNNCGAYSVTEGIHLFLSRTMPLILLRTAENEYIVAREMQESYPINTIQNYQLSSDCKGGSMSQVTKRALEQSLKNLLLKKPLSKITISDLTEDCGMNRMTFYYHFKDIYDLVEWACLTDAKRALDEKKTYDTWQQGFLQILEAVQANKPFIMNVYHCVHREQVEMYLRPLVEDLILNVVNEETEGLNVRDEDKTFIVQAYSYIFIGIMLDWIKEDMKENPQEIVERLNKLIKGSIRASLTRFQY